MKDCIRLQQQLTRVRVKALVADSIYANNANRKFCTKYHISTSFKRKGRAAKDERFVRFYGRNSAVKELPAWKEVLERRSNITHWPG